MMGGNGGVKMTNKLRASLALNWLRGLALLAAMVAGPSHAALYTGVWDPTYGSPFGNLGWRGSADFSVPDSCLPIGTADVINATACGGGAAVTGARVELYDTTDTAQTTLATLVFNETTLVIGTLRFIEGALTELTTTDSNLVAPAADLTAFGVTPFTEFFLNFGLDGPHLGWATCAAVANFCQTGGFNDGTQFPPTFTITRVVPVPEPTTLWLAGLALLSLVPVRRIVAARPR